MNLIHRACAMAVIVCVCGTSIAAAQENRSKRTGSTLILDQATGETYLSQGNSTRRVTPGDRLRVRSRNVNVRVINTVTALNSYELAFIEDESSQLGAVSEFSSDAAPYLDFIPGFSFVSSILLRDVRGGDVSAEVIESYRSRLRYDAAASVDHFLSRVNDLTTRSALEHEYGLQEIRVEIFTALAAMDWALGHEHSEDRVLAEREVLRSRLGGRITADNGRLAIIGDLVEAYQDLAQESKRLQHYAAWLHAAGALTVADSLNAAQKLTAASVELGRASQTIEAAKALEQTVLKVANAEPQWEESFTVGFAEGKRVRVAVAPQDLLGVRASSRPHEVEFVLERRWPLRPSLGVVGLYVPGARHIAEFGAEPLDDGYRIVATEETDATFTWALGLSLTPSFLEGPGLSVSPQLLVTPGTSVRAMGAGATVSLFSTVDLALGVMWTKHERLQEMGLGQVISSPDQIRTRETYGQASPYVGLSIRGIQDLIR